MTALFMDGFDHYGTTATTNILAPISNMLDGTWSSITPYTGGPVFEVTNPPWGTSRTGLGCLRMNTNSVANAAAVKVLSTATPHLFISFGFALDMLPTTLSPQFIIDFRNGSGTTLYSLGVTPTGDITLYNGPQTSVVATTAGPVVRAQTWHFFELEIDLTGGTFTLRVDDAQGTDTPALTTGISTGLSTSAIAFGQYSVTTFNLLAMNWDDLFIRNSAGSINNGWLGDRRIATLPVNADTTTLGWTPSYYRKFGAGILTLGYAIPNTTTVQNPNAYISAAAASSLDIGSSDFTLETMVRFDALPAATAYSTIFGRWDTVANHRSYRFILGGSSYNGGSLQFDTSTDGTASTIATPIIFPWTPTLNTWYHIALVRAAGDLLLFVNGQQFGLPIVDSRTYYSGGSEVLSIGSEVQGTNTYVANTGLAGRLDETRFTNGVGRYTTSFTPPSAAFTRGSGDAYWSSVTLLMGYDGAITDESSFLRTITTQNGAVQFTPGDGSTVGNYSTLNKIIPDDNTFISAGLTNATNILTMTTQPSNGDTVTVGTKNGSTAAVYTFKTAITTAFDVLIDTTAQNTLLNLYNAINAGSGAGTKYGTSTTANYDVNAIQLAVGQIQVIANVAGTSGNSISSTKTGTAASWATTTLTGGAGINGPSQFKFMRPPNNTTLISAMQTVVRALKTDAGTATIQTALIGPLGGTQTGATHNIATSPDFYSDIIEIDPDTSGALTPTTIINGKFQINRTA